MEEEQKPDWCRVGKEFNTMVYNLVMTKYRFCEGLTWNDNKEILWFGRIFIPQLKKKLLYFISDKRNLQRALVPQVEPKKPIRKKYTTEEKREIFLSLLKTGSKATSRKFGIPYQTVKNWENKLKKNKVL